MKTILNRKLLLAVKAQILKEPGQFVMDNFFSAFNDMGQTPPNCGTAACIGGWAICLNNKLSPSAFFSARHAWNSYIGNAGAVLGLNTTQSIRLMIFARWPAKLRSQYFKAQTMKSKAQVAAKRIDWFIKTGK